jgi:hypothetical protein
VTDIISTRPDIYERIEGASEVAEARISKTLVVRSVVPLLVSSSSSNQDLGDR